MANDPDLFIIDEINVSSSTFSVRRNNVKSIFDPDNKNVNKKSFGGETMLFLGDAVHLRPVCGAAIYDEGFGEVVVNSTRNFAHAL